MSRNRLFQLKKTAALVVPLTIQLLLTTHSPAFAGPLSGLVQFCNDTKTDIISASSSLIVIALVWIVLGVLKRNSPLGETIWVAATLLGGAIFVLTVNTIITTYVPS